MSREKYNSRQVTSDGKNSRFQLQYRLLYRGKDSAAAMSELKSVIPSDVEADGVVLDHVVPTVQEIGAGLWTGQATYQHRASGTAQSQNMNLAEIDDTEVSLSFGTETQKITQARTTASDVVGQTAYDIQGELSAPIAGKDDRAINVTDDGVDGVDIIVPAGDVTITKVFDRAVITDAWIRNRANKRCKTNSDTFYGFEPGELLFVRMALTIRNSGDTQVSFAFSQRENETIPAAQLNTIGDVDKKAHQYLWVRYKQTEDNASSSVTSKSVGVYVATVYDETDFASLLSTTP